MHSSDTCLLHGGPQRLQYVLTHIRLGRVGVKRVAVSLIPLTIIMVAVVLVLAATPELANEDELRVRRNQLVITEATPFCVDEGKTRCGSVAPIGGRSRHT